MPEQGSVTDFSTVTIHLNEKDMYERRRHTVCCGLTAREILKFAIHLLLPLSLGLFTIIVTLYQQQVAAQQREQDLNISLKQREQDKQIAREQREEDELRRYQDLNISASRRDLDVNLTTLKRDADDLNADKQRNMSRDQREHELEVEQQRYEHQMKVEKDRYDHENEKYFSALALSFINEIGVLFDKNNGSLTSNPTTAALVRAKTINVIGQIGANRSKQIIQFLYDANQLKINGRPLSLIGARLNGIDLRDTNMNNLSLIGFHLNGAIFEGMQIVNWNFVDAHLDYASFRSCTIIGTNFTRTSMIGVDFTSSNLDSTSFRRVDLTKAIFKDVTVTPYQGNIIFDSTKLEQSDFTNTRFGFVSNTSYMVYFRYSSLTSAIFRGVHFHSTNIEFCDMTRADLTGATFEYLEIYGSTLAFASLVNLRTVLHKQMFPFTNLSHANLTGSKCLTNICKFEKSLSIYQALLPDGTFGRSPFLHLLQASAYSCQKTVLEDTNIWNISKSKSNILIRSESASSFGVDGCVFSLKDGAPETTMTQKIDLNWFRSLIDKGEAVATFHVSVSEGIQIIVEEILEKKGAPRQHYLKKRETTSSSDSSSSYIISVSFLLKSNTNHLVIIIKFTQRTTDSLSRWWDYIDFEINPNLKRI